MTRGIVWLSLLAFLLLDSCGQEKECPGFSDNLLPYIPQESRLVFRNVAGDSLVFNTLTFSKTPPRTVKQNVLSVGGTGSKPYCVSNCSLGSVIVPSDSQSLGYIIDVDNEANACTLRVSMASQLPSNDYFMKIVPFSPVGKLFGDTILLSNSSPTTDPRFSRIEIIHGRGLVGIQDDVKKCWWKR
jgi:hypothetical protein